MFVKFLSYLTGVLTAVAANPVTAEPVILWRVENPFRLFLDASDTDLHRAVFDNLTPAERTTPILSTERRLGGRFPFGWSEQMFSKTCWSAVAQRYACEERPDYADPKNHRVRAQLTAADPEQTCRWSITSPGAETKPQFTGSCSKPVSLDIPYPGASRVSVASQGRELASVEIGVRDIFILGLGDSFAAGDGNPDAAVRYDDSRSVSYRSDAKHSLDGYPARVGPWHDIGDTRFLLQDAGWMSTACHRSLYGHQFRVALQLALEDPHSAVTFASFACWGDDTVEGMMLPRVSTKLVPNMPRLGQLFAAAHIQCGARAPAPARWARAFDMGGSLPRLAELDGYVCPPKSSRKIDLVLVSIGGNDVGFANVVANAVLAETTPLRTLSNLFGRLGTAEQARAALPELTPRLKALNRAFHTILHIPWEESDRIVLAAYPPIALKEGGKQACDSGQQGLTVNPAFALDQRRARASEELSNPLYSVIQGLAIQQRWTFADAHRSAFAHHGLCVSASGRLADPADDMRLPRLIAGDWRPYPPSQWQPYAPRKRWIRTPNDGFLTVNFHVGDMQDAPLNLLFASSYSGGFHPTAEGQAAIADAVADKARKVLAKYSQE